MREVSLISLHVSKKEKKGEVKREWLLLRLFPKNAFSRLSLSLSYLFCPFGFPFAGAIFSPATRAPACRLRPFLSCVSYNKQPRWFLNLIFNTNKKLQFIYMAFCSKYLSLKFKKSHCLWHGMGMGGAAGKRGGKRRGYKERNEETKSESGRER